MRRKEVIATKSFLGKKLHTYSIYRLRHSLVNDEPPVPQKRKVYDQGPMTTRSRPLSKFETVDRSLNHNLRK